MTSEYLQRGNERGTWKRVGDDVQIVCPKCGKIAFLDHDIADDGTVTPSVVCPRERCDWHVMVVLVGWGTPDIQVHLNADPNMSAETRAALGELVTLTVRAIEDGTL
jgi:hypothetical protein